MYRRFCARCGEEYEGGQGIIYKHYCDYCGKEVSEKRYVEVELSETAAIEARKWNREPEERFIVLGLCNKSFQFHGEPLCCIDCMIKLLQKAKEAQCQTTST